MNEVLLFTLISWSIGAIVIFTKWKSGCYDTSFTKTFNSPEEHQRWLAQGEPGCPKHLKSRPVDPRILESIKRAQMAQSNYLKSIDKGVKE